MALRRQVKNVVKNLSDVEVKVREATSNDPWGPSSSLMSYIADSTYNMAAFSDIMSMLWKRLNDHGKNWRHVYKSLVVLDYIIKTGSERVGQQCRENIFAIQTLKDFQYIDKDGKDQGVNIREKSKQLVLLLKDDERLKNERQRALKAKERFAQSHGGIGNTNFNKNKRLTAPPRTDQNMKRTTLDDSSIPSSTTFDTDREPDRRSTDGRFTSEMEKARPSNEAEEEMQLQIALAMSREQADQEQTTDNGDQQRLKMCLQRSSSDAQSPTTRQGPTLLDLTDPLRPPAFGVSPPSNDPWGLPQSTAQQPAPVQAVDPWAPAQHTSAPSMPMGAVFAPNPVAQPDPWSSQPAQPVHTPSMSSNGWGNTTQPSADPWAPTPVAVADPFAPQTSSSNGFDPRATSMIPQQTPNPFEMNGIGSSLPTTNNSAIDDGFLGEFGSSKLVNFDNLAGLDANQSSAVTNPFGMPITEKTTNPFAQEKPKPKSINEIRYAQSNFNTPASSQSTGFISPSNQPAVLLPQPLIPVDNVQANNPFL